MSDLYQFLTLIHPTEGKIPVRNPVHHYHERLKYNLANGISECSYLRQTGRTTLMLLLLLENALRYPGQYYVITHSLDMIDVCRKKLTYWLDQIRPFRKFDTWQDKDCIILTFEETESQIDFLLPAEIPNHLETMNHVKENVFIDNVILDIPSYAKEVEKYFK